jgi:hypothetical protein
MTFLDMSVTILSQVLDNFGCSVLLCLLVQWYGPWPTTSTLSRNLLEM